MKIGRVFLSVMLHQAKESEEKIILGCISAGCPGDNLDNKSDFGLESGPLDYRISSRTKSCAGDSDLQENVFFSGKLSGLIFFFFSQPSKAREEAFIMWLLYREQVVGILTRAQLSFLLSQGRPCLLG